MKRLLALLTIFLSINVAAQNDRINDFNNTNWLQTFHTIPLSKKWSLHGEYQWRREQGLKNWQQGLLRIGVNRKLNDNVIAHIGYAWIQTFQYGDYPIANNGTFPEHRLYEQLTFRQPISKWLFAHRFRIEQRWLGRIKAGTTANPEVEGWNFLHRFRYQFRTQYTLCTKKQKQLYAAAADEIFIGAGKKVGVNIFDQNRIFLLLGLKVNAKLAVEAGCFNQTLQQGRRINNATIMQRNNGVVISTIFQW